MSNVLVVFQANSEEVEQLALSIAVGAVESEALIRLRRLAAADAPEVGHKSYARLQAGDLMWAEICVVILEDAVPNFEELDPMLDLLSEIERRGVLAWTLGAGGPDAPKTEAQSVVERALRDAGFLVMQPDSPDPEDQIPPMKRLGRLAGERAAKASKDL
jgi:hypothetical protein